MKLITKNGKEVHYNTKDVEIYVQGPGVRMHSVVQFDSIHFDKYVMIINVERIRENKEHPYIQLHTNLAEVSFNDGVFTWTDKEIEYEIKMDPNLGKVVYLSSVDPENEFFDTLPDYTPKNGVFEIRNGRPLIIDNDGEDWDVNEYNRKFD